MTRVSGDHTHPANFGSLCTKGSTVHQTIHTADRLAHAQRRRAGGTATPGRGGPFQRVPLDVALQEVADGLRRIVDQHGPDAIAFYISGQLSTETQYVANKLAKGFLRTNNIDSNSRLCMASAASGYKLSLGADGPPGHYEDFEQADGFLVIGSNMADCHPILHQRMRPPHADRRGETHRGRSPPHRDRRRRHALPAVAARARTSPCSTAGCTCSSRWAG